MLGPDFRRLWAASAVSNLGDGALLAAGPLLVASITPSPAAVGLAAFAGQLPWLMFSLLSGVLVDRLDRRLVVVVANVFRGVVLGALAAFVALGNPPLLAVYLTLFLLGSAETMADNAGGALLTAVVPKEDLGKANSRFYGTFMVGNQLAGPPLGALLFAAGRAVPLALDAVSFLVAALVIGRMTRQRRPRTPGKHLRREIAEGVRWLWNHAGVRTLALAILVMNITFCAAFATWVLYARQRLGLSETQFGLLLTAVAVGGLAGTPAYHWLEPRVGTVGLMRAGLVIETSVHLVLWLTHDPWVAGVTMLLFGVHAVVWGRVSTTARQLATPDALLGRVTSVYLLASVGGAALGSLLGGLIAQGFGLTAPFAFAFVAMVAVTVVAWGPVRQVSVTKAAQPRS